MGPDKHTLCGACSGAVPIILEGIPEPGQSVRRFLELHTACTLAFGACDITALARPSNDSRAPPSCRGPVVRCLIPTANCRYSTETAARPCPLQLQSHPTLHPTPTPSFPLPSRLLPSMRAGFDW